MYRLTAARIATMAGAVQRTLDEGERGVRVLLECVSRAATHEQRFHA